MTNSRTRSYRTSPAAAAVVALLLSAMPMQSFVAPASAATVQVYVNGSQMQFDQPPIERAGRVFVPLRSIFERLGASVVYSNGTINATGANGATVLLTIGSHTAYVGGKQVFVDVAPFVVGSRTLVPLRFVSESLGATVGYDDSTQTVTITSSGAPPAASVSLTNLNPGNGAVVSAIRPAISGNFSQAVDPNSVKITIDGRDVSSTTYVSSTNFLFTPPYDLSATSHGVRVTGRSQSGTSFDQSWSFTSGTNQTVNRLRNLSPANGATVSGSFTVSGTALPNSSVHIAAVASSVLGGIFRVGTGSYTADLTADSNGRFAQAISLNVVSGGNVSVRITATDPSTGASAVATLNYHT